MNTHKISGRFFTFAKRLTLALGLIFTFLVILSFTSFPFWAYYWLGTSLAETKEKPEYIIMLGGGGMPSESNLIRSYYVHKIAQISPGSKIIISIPGNISDSTSTAKQVANELILKGINSSRIIFEAEGTNTRWQALKLNSIDSIDLKNKSIMLVTSPEHMRRAILVFRKTGFKKISALPAFETAIETDLFFEDDKLGGNKTLIPDIGNKTSVRYNFWNHLKYQILIARESAALTYYWMRGWI